MSKLEVDKIDPQSGTDLELGSSGDTITVPTGVTLDASNATTTLPANVVTTDGTQTLTNKSINASQLTGTITPSDGTVTNAKVNASAAIDYSKLNLTGNIALADLSATGTKDATTFLRGDNTFAEAGGGKILQVISSTGADYNQSNTSTSFVDVTKSSSTWETAITPSSTSSKIFVTAIMNYGITGTHAQHRITIKTQGKIGSGSYSDLANTGVLGIYSGSTEPDSNHAIAFNALWSPSTTNECKVKFVWQNTYTSSDMTTKINPSGTSHTTVTLMEVAG